MPSLSVRFNGRWDERVLPICFVHRIAAIRHVSLPPQAQEPEEVLLERHIEVAKHRSKNDRWIVPVLDVIVIA